MKAAYILLLALTTFALALPTRDSKAARTQFEAWRSTHNKNYATVQEKEDRYLTWLSNSKTILELREKNPHARYGHTKFADLTPSEFSRLYLNSARKSLPDAPKVHLDENAPLPTEFDWRTRNAVTPVKDQGQCGSCWAFSVAETIESQWFLAGHNLTELSPQQIVDCDVGRGDEGCNGGDTPTAYEYVIAAGGLDSEDQYPYTAEDGTCAFKQPVAAKISSWKYITKTKNETEMQLGLMQYGPLSICVDAASWQFYFGGVITFFCGTDLDHCVQITGISVQSFLGFHFNVWNVRNSWGADWGEEGYIWVERGKDLCGVAEEVTIPIV